MLVVCFLPFETWKQFFCCSHLNCCFNWCLFEPFLFPTVFFLNCKPWTLSQVSLLKPFIFIESWRNCRIIPFCPLKWYFNLDRQKSGGERKEDYNIFSPIVLKQWFCNYFCLIVMTFQLPLGQNAKYLKLVGRCWRAWISLSLSLLTIIDYSYS